MRKISTKKKKKKKKERKKGEMSWSAKEKVERQSRHVCTHRMGGLVGHQRPPLWDQKAKYLLKDQLNLLPDFNFRNSIGTQ